MLSSVLKGFTSNKLSKSDVSLSLNVKCLVLYITYKPVKEIKYCIKLRQDQKKIELGKEVRPEENFNTSTVGCMGDTSTYRSRS